MATTDAESSPAEVQLEGGTYEIIRNRLLNHQKDLNQRLDLLNQDRKAVFGSIETALVSTERVTTKHNCIPRDMVPVGNRFIFGYNVHLGLKTETHVSDVLSVYRYDADHTFHAISEPALEDPAFTADFKNLYKYYREARFVKFAQLGPHLYMVFQISKDINDIKAFKWLIKPEGDLQYLNNRSDHEVVLPDQHEFDWVRTRREAHRVGNHPHISIDDRVFVETVGGDLTIKVEDNTDTGQGIYSEPVDHLDQTLDDAEIYYAIIGHLVVLKMKPYQETEFRYILFNEKMQTAIRVDALEDSCVLLPDDHGIIFPKGFYLQTGEFKLFDNPLENMLFDRRLQSPNGEDYLFVFYNKVTGAYILLGYNLIEQQVDTPIICHGFSIFENGELCFFRDDQEQKKHHVIQVWQTPFYDQNLEKEVASKSYLYKLGNKDIVRAMAECREITKLLLKEDSYANLYIDLVKGATDVLDSFHWLDKAETHELNVPLQGIKETASAAIEEFEKVQRIRKNTAQETQRVMGLAAELKKEIRANRPENINDFVSFLSRLRGLRGEVISLKELRYVNLEPIETQEAALEELTDRLSQDCVTFLLGDTALAPYEEQVEDMRVAIDNIQKVVEANDMDEQISETSQQLEMLIEIVSNLKIEDATQTTRIIDQISTIYSHFNQIIAALRKKRKTLLGQEGKAEFNAQLKLIDQGMANYLDLCDTPEKCEEYLTKLMVQLEELEGKFAEFDQFITTLSEKREDIYNAFESKKVNLIEQRNRRATSLLQSADRILKGIKSRLSSFGTVQEINGYYASDLMVDKVRDIVDRLKELGDTVKVDDIQSRLKTIREEAVRQLKDRTELFEDGENIIRFGKHRFSVNTQPLDLTLVLRDDNLYYHLTGTNFFEAVDDTALKATQEVWEQHLLSENREVYRSEYLAYQLLLTAQHPEQYEGNGVQVLPLNKLLQLTDEELLAHIRQFMAPRFQEGYVKGVHDQDAMQLLHHLLHLASTSDLLRYNSEARACGALYWKNFAERDHQAFRHEQLKGIGNILKAFPDTREFEGIIRELQEEVAEFVAASGLFADEIAEDAGAYLFYSLIRDRDFIVSQNAANLVEQFNKRLQAKQQQTLFEESTANLQDRPKACYRLIKSWLNAFVENPDDILREYVDEAALLLLNNDLDARNVVHVNLDVEIEGLTGSHPLLEDTKHYHLNFNHFLLKMRHFCKHTVPLFEDFTNLKKTLVDNYRDELRLNEFKPRVMSSFVRNRLIDEVYLPVIGDNLAKQIGTAGESKRTDLMGMLLLISPPGYGKTTLMEYLASRLGIIFMKINGPAIGHRVTSLDPSEAGNASAREELEKLNLALEMGDNVMLYLDDIQHCNPEFLQKFISLCDAQRKIEGVYKGTSKTYDLRGKKVCVVMAGNPYTESGEKFQIPDMLANRADIYNLGDIIGDSAEAFKLSYLENCLTSNPTLAKLATKSHKDVISLVKMVESGQKEGIEFEANHSVEELREYQQTLGKLLQVRDIILRVNREYIDSAGQADEFRTEPPFKLQGSYRNMNKIAERVVPIMNQEELDTLIHSYYQSEAQTLTTGAESNLLRFREMNEQLSEEEAERWASIKATFQKNQRMKGMGGNQLGRVLEQMGDITTGLSGIRDALLQSPVDDEQDEPNGK